MIHGFCLAKPSFLPDPRTTVEAFCKAEFEGNEDSYTMVTLSKRRQILISKKYPGEHLSIGDMITGSYACDPVVVVNSYRILGITVEGSTAKAEVEYEIIGEFKDVQGNRCTDNFALGKQVQRVTLILRYANGKNGMGWIRGTAWYIEDPSIPKVSASALMLTCQKKLEGYRNIAKKAQKKGLDIPTNIKQGIEIFEKKYEILNNLKP